MKHTILTIIFALFSLAGSAQSSRKVPYDSISNKKSELRIGLRYTSDYYFMGRSDSAAAPYLTPTLAYYHKSGFFIRSSLSYLTTEDQGRIDMIAFTGGYDYYGEKFALGASLTEYLFSDESYVVQAEMSTYINAYAGYDFDAFMLFADASLGVSDGTDLFVGLDISRMFFLLRNKLTILPSVTMNLGSQKYYDQYYQYRSPQSGFGKGSGKGKNGQQPPQPAYNVYLTESDKFQILDYEAGLQVTYRLHNVRFFTSGTWMFPVNPATIIVNDIPQSETLQNGFYWSTGVRVSLKGK